MAVSGGTGGRLFRRLTGRSSVDVEAPRVTELHEEHEPEAAEGGEGGLLHTVIDTMGLNKTSGLMRAGAMGAGFLPGGMVFAELVQASVNGFANPVERDEAMEELLKDANFRREVLAELNPQEKEFDPHMHVRPEDALHVIARNNPEMGRAVEEKYSVEGGVEDSLLPGAAGLAAGALVPGGMLVHGGAMLAGSIGGSMAMDAITGKGDKGDRVALLLMLAKIGPMGATVSGLATAALRTSEETQRDIENRLGMRLEEAIATYVEEREHMIAAAGGDPRKAHVTTKMKHITETLKHFDPAIRGEIGIEDGIDDGRTIGQVLHAHGLNYAQVGIGDLNNLLEDSEVRKQPASPLQVTPKQTAPRRGGMDPLAAKVVATLQSRGISINDAADVLRSQGVGPAAGNGHGLAAPTRRRDDGPDFNRPA